MASSTSYFQIEDQTDEDFFDKLVDDDFEGSQSKSEEIIKVLSNLSLGDINSSLDDSVVSESADKVETTDKADVLNPEEAPTRDLDENYPLKTLGSFDSDKIEVGVSDLSTGKSDGSKGTIVKEVHWSAFSVNSSQEFEKADGFEPYSDFLAENADGFVAKPVESFSSNAGFIEQQDSQLSGSANEQTVDQNDPKYWESLYPGWKYDMSTGQWYPVDTYDATMDAQLDNSNAASVDPVSETLRVSYLQQTSQPVLETIAEECTVSSVSNYNTQVGMEYPSNMVFDPQYPEWYYDTNTQEWYTLESYTQGLATDPTSNVVEDRLPEAVNASAGFSLEQNHSLYGSMGQDEQNDIKGEGFREVGDAWNASAGNYAQQTQSAERASQGQGTQDFRQTWDASMSNYDQKNSLYSNISHSEQTTSQVWGSQDFGQNWSASMSKHAQQTNLHGNISPTGDHGGRGQRSQDFGQSWDASINNYSQPNSLFSNISHSEQNINQGQVSLGFGGHSNASQSTDVLQNMWQPQQVSNNAHSAGFSANQQTGSFYGTIPGSQTTQQTGFKAFEPVVRQNYGSGNGPLRFHSFAPTESMHKFNQSKMEQSLQERLSDGYYGDQNTVNCSQQSFLGAIASPFSYAPTEGRSSTGRLPHALVAFGFGGKLIVMKNVNSFGTALDHGSQENSSGVISVLSLSEVVKDKDDASGIITGSSHGYFHALCQPSFPGPLVGGNAAAKDVNKWMDEKIAYCESTSMDVRKGEFLKLLLSLLKIMCQHYGKLRSPFGADPSLEEIDGPELAVTKLFASARNIGACLTELGSSTHCMQNLPSVGQIRATAIEVQNLLVSGRRKEALQYAQEGQLWGPALVLAAQLGEKFYVETVKKMAQRQFVSGSPLRTLCLLFAGQPADVFSADSSPMFSAANAPHGQTQVLANGMLDDWEKNLAIITANRTKDDELVIIHLGDCLLKERGEIVAAHMCYMVAETNFESYSDSARLCLIGADHWKSPRTYASPEAIQRTEVYEYSKVLGNSQFILLPFQPYKLIYAYMLAEVGKVSDSLRYCQSSLKLLKNSSRSPEVEMWKTLFSSLEERLRTHQQGGYSSNLAPAKLVGKLFTSIDRSIHRMIGAPPAALPPMPPSSANSKEGFSNVPKVAGSQSTMAMSSLMPSASVEAISEWSGDGGRKSMHNRSVSEPDFSRSPKDAGSANGQSKSSGAPSRFGRIGSQLLQKTMGWVSRSRPDRQAKLGESNKFYYDEKLKRWVEEGAEPPVEEAALPPPPTAVAFQNGATDYSINSALKIQSPASNGGPETGSPIPLETNSGIPPIPPSQNQFSARGRMGVRSRYVDTFNKGAASGTGGMSTTSFQSPAAPSVKPGIGAKFFVPAAPAHSDATGETIQELTTTDKPSTSLAKAHFSLPSSSSSPPPLPSLQRFPSMDSISPSSDNANGPFSRTRALSWSGTYSTASNHKMAGLGNGSPPQFFPQNLPSTRSSSSSSLQLNGGPIGDELHEVEL